MNKSEILKEIQNSLGKSSLKFPSSIEIKETSGVITITLSDDGVIKNMQDNAAAFEGWILGLKAIVRDWSFCLCWKEPKELHNGHYQRFLYRVAKFSNLFGGKGGWFSVGDECLLDALKIKPNKQGYVLNHPSTAPQNRTNSSSDSHENLLENMLVKIQPKSLLNLFQIQKLHRQLPMGVFEDKVSRDTAIFTCGKSAADLWGISKDGSLILFELKADGNNQVGVISELFFYAMVLADEQRGKFMRHGNEGKVIQDTRLLKAMVLAPEIHPLITGGVFALLNANEKGIEFGYVKIDYKREF